MVDIDRVFETKFEGNSEGVDDHFYTKLFMMPFELRVYVPTGYKFNIIPTFDEKKLLEPEPDRGAMVYQIPFLFPGQGFSFALIKEP